MLLALTVAVRPEMAVALRGGQMDRDGMPMPRNAPMNMPM
jgi:hypothetical protein